jgi:hypothetical protein
MDWLGVEPRRLGTGLLAFGLVGMVLAGIIALGLFAGGLAARDLDDRIAADQGRLVAALERLTTSIDKLATTTDHAGTTLRTTSQIVDQAGLVLDDVAATSDELAGNLDFSVLGQQPLAGAATKFTALSARIREFRASFGMLSQDLATNADDLAALTVEIQGIGQLTADLAARLDAYDSAGRLAGLVVGGILLGGLLVAWLAIAAALCAWAGWRLRRAAAAGATPGAAPG